MPPDAELLRRYVETGSEQAFTALVERHVPLIYSAALRQVSGDPHRAQEIVQSVFTLLARKARALRDHPALVGWLYTSTYHVAAKLRRAEQRRLRREQPGPLMHDNVEPIEVRVEWERMRPVIDDLMLQLQERDRTAVLLRFFENRPYREIGEQLGLSENAVRMRVDRSLEVIRSALVLRGIASTSAALGVALATEAVSAAPTGLAGTVAAGAVSVTVGSGLTLFMSSTLVKISLAAAVVLAGSVGLFRQQQLVTENNRLRAALTAEQKLRAELPAAPVGAASPGNGPTQTAPLQATGSTPGEAARANLHDPEKELTRLQYFRNVGRATPAAAVQTILWAVVHGDEALPDMMFLNKATLKSARELLAALPASARPEDETPEKLAALYLSREILERIDTVQITGVTQLDPETVEVTLLTGERGPTTVSMQLTPNGWLWKVKASVIENARQELLRPQTKEGETDQPL